MAYARKEALVTIVLRMLPVASWAVPYMVSSKPNGMGRVTGKRTIL